MKNIKSQLLIMATACMFLSCSDSEMDPDTCEDRNSTKVTFANTSDMPLKVVVSTSITPQYEPINPLFSLDLAPGQSIVREFDAGRYISSWYNGCPSNCNVMGNFFRDFDQCSEYEEKQ